MSDAAVFSEVSNRKVREAMAVPLKILLQGYCMVVKKLYSWSLTVFYFGWYFVITSNQKARDKEDGLTDQ